MTGARAFNPDHARAATGDAVNEFWKFLEDGWAWVALFIVTGGGGWVAHHFDASLASLARRRASRLEHRKELRRLTLEAKRRELEVASPGPVRPTCGCGHDLAFHNVRTNACHYSQNDSRCTCQRYVGPEPLAQLYAPPLSDEGDGDA
jgi:hypothetical protein